MRIVLGVEYDGTGFCGWQSQPGGCGVQDCLENALRQMAGHEIRVTAAGRTDAGVHALCQVIHFDTTAERPVNAWVRGVNTYLPAAVRVLWAQQVDEAFHARFDALQRRYQYLLVNQPVAPALMAKRVGWFHLPLEVEAMTEAAGYLVGEHDFSAFRAAECQAKSPIKHLCRADVRKIGNCLLFEFWANAFLHHQVRNMVGALVYIGKGKYPPEYIQQLLRGRDRTQSPPTFSPEGLYLAGVNYDGKWGLPEVQHRLTFLEQGM